MAKIKIGDVVARASYNKDVFFKVVDIFEEKGYCTLRGLNVRVLADAPIDDLILPTSTEIREYKKDYIKKSNESMERIFYRRELEKQKRFVRSELEENNGFFDVPGIVLHIDGDEEYLDLCLNTYRQLDIEAYGISLLEREQPKKIHSLLIKYNPDILVITGHDGLLKEKKDFSDVNNYRNSKYFIEAVQNARRFEPSLDDLVIFAGACQSHYEGILRAGANFASSPHRVFIHALDPVFIIEKIAFTSINKIISARDIIDATITGIKGIGGVETRGKLREGLPRSPYE
ncbi:Sporulation-specific protease YabG [Tepidanaerobacter acetatoxydans Re1]|uniref:Sporulation-specific protease YabG n=1 Tax=Tepidanaerobacter acetatoxydans (strain DSM 21804 / JCM 16047 / Re1) TaxID=1209989 RepID=F4LRM7_TEPAE|nr:sporulation peptidase YabG [Tepidanaerobacter acetatoxydans]AEE90290.1 sporulation peptidase YabG [Tepidanaerobacter acetatoxydans Re1]CCP24766.1 Sporulation-specific protease YabG [Tepidanaerobacter acetatoxydans Re1]